MHHPRKFLTLAALVALAPFAVAQSDLEKKVTTTLTLAEAGTLAQVWSASSSLLAIDGADEDALARAITGAAKSTGPKGRLAAARALIDLSDGAALGNDVLETLQPVLGSDDAEMRSAGMTLLGRDVFTRGTLKQVLELLASNATSELVDPKVRVAAAKSLWARGSTEDRRKAQTTLGAFVQSADRGLRVAGALALAEMNDMEMARSVLREVADEPSLEGRLARAMLDREGDQRVFDRRLQQVLERSGGDAGAFVVLQEVMNQVKAIHPQGSQVSESFLLDNAAKGMLNALDRHTDYFTSSEYQRFFFDLNRDYGGIGAFVNFDADDDFSVVRPIYSGPAYKVGVLTGDKILEVDGWETRDHTSDEIITRLKGKPGSTVIVKVLRAGWNEPRDIPIVRQQILVPSVNQEILPGGIGYAELVTFGAQSSKELRKSIDKLIEDGAQGLVLDLRNNTGGLLNEARDIVELFVAGDERVVYTKGRIGPQEEYRTRGRAPYPELPLVVLTNGFSASASEIVAGALQDFKRAKVVGERSYGKGTVQSLLALDTAPAEPFVDENGNRRFDEWEKYEDKNSNGKYDVGAHVKMTVAKYYLPSGRCPHKDIDPETRKIINPDWGVTPDVVVKFREFEPKEAWKNAELFELVQKDVFRTYVKERMEAHKDLFMQLADGDQGTDARYPDFDAFYAKLDTKLGRDDIRRWIRFSVRDAVADLRGRAYPGGRAFADFQEDMQLQEAVRLLMTRLGKDIREVPEYKPVLKIADAGAEAVAPAGKK